MRCPFTPVVGVVHARFPNRAAIQLRSTTDARWTGAVRNE
jgi:hypothetical protein